MASFVTLNVGGKQYLTSQSTLLTHPDSFFANLLDGTIPSTRNDEGHYLIDRDGKIFRHVLNFLRCRSLILPDGFNEYDLLECEAKFFRLWTLLTAIDQHTRGAIGLRVGRKTFRITTKEALREQNSFFAKMLNGKISVPRDALGNYVIERDSSMFPFVLSYLRDGCLFMIDTLPTDLTLLTKEAKYFGLQVLAHHIESIQFMQHQIIKKSRPLYLHLFYNDNEKCVMYANKDNLSGWICTWFLADICFWHLLFDDGMFAGMIDETNVIKMNRGRDDITLGDVITLIRNKMGKIKEQKVIELNDNWTKVMFSSS